MCRRNQLLGWCGCSFGMGVLVGAGLESGILCLALGAGLILAGISIVRRR